MTDKSQDFQYLNPSSKIEFPAKVNIHFPIRGELFFHSLEVNKTISEITRNEIDFQASSFHIPHITLYMGFIENFTNMMSVLNKTEEISTLIKRFEINASKPYIKGPRNNWVFLDISPEDKIISIKEKVRSITRDFITPLSWDVVGETPHITVGYIKSRQDVVKNALQTIRGGISSYAEAVEISFSGARGTSLGSIRTFEIRGS